MTVAEKEFMEAAIADAVAREREACAKLAEDRAARLKGDLMYPIVAATAAGIAKGIRGRE